jgi:hypothetical protein
MKFKLIIGGVLLAISGCTPQKKVVQKISSTNKMNYESRIIKGGISGKTIQLPEVNASSNNSIIPDRFILDGKPITDFALDTSKNLHDVKSFKRKFGLIIPATNTSMEYEIWSIIFNNQ